MRKVVQLNWAAPGDERFRIAQASDLEAFQGALEEVRNHSIVEDLTYQVDMYARPRSLGDPILIQFLVGPHDRSSLLWHMDGYSFTAVDPRVGVWQEGIDFARFHGFSVAPPALTRIHLKTATDALTAYLLSGERTESLLWNELEAD
jgi:hypothetical protein